MRVAILWSIMGASAAMADSRFVAVPSQTPLYVQEVVFADMSAHLRLVLAPDAGSLTRARVNDDFEPLCARLLETLIDHGRDVQVIVVAISDRETPFGKTTPEALQMFEAYDITDNSCQWRAF